VNCSPLSTTLVSNQTSSTVVGGVETTIAIAMMALRTISATASSTNNTSNTYKTIR
jgi:hypothetical protein